MIVSGTIHANEVVGYRCRCRRKNTEQWEPWTLWKDPPSRRDAAWEWEILPLGILYFGDKKVLNGFIEPSALALFEHDEFGDIVVYKQKLTGDEIGCVVVL